MRPARLLALALLATAACGAAEPSRTQPRPDKARLYGDPGLVPSRDGERARGELALGADLEQALATTPGVANARAVVRSDDAGLRVVVGVERHADADPAEVESAARQRVELLAPEASLVLDSRPLPAAPSAPTGLPVGLALVLLGLGSSLGVLLERLRQRSITRA